MSTWHLVIIFSLGICGLYILGKTFMLGSRARVRLRLSLGGPCCLAMRSCWTSTRWAQILKAPRGSPGKMHLPSPSPGSWGGPPVEPLPSSDGRKLSLCLMSTRGQTVLGCKSVILACSLLGFCYLMVLGRRGSPVPHTMSLPATHL